LLDAGVTLTQRVTRSWELVGRASRQILDYRQLETAGAADAGTDHGYIYGGGIGYRVGEALRLGADANYSTRRSDFEDSRDYEGLRVFGSISYGIRQ
jgi:hypothetical protein